MLLNTCWTVITACIHLSHPGCAPTLKKAYYSHIWMLPPCLMVPLPSCIILIAGRESKPEFESSGSHCWKNDALYERLLKRFSCATTLGQPPPPVSDPAFQEKVWDSRKKKSRIQRVWSKHMILEEKLKALGRVVWVAKVKYLKSN